LILAPNTTPAELVAACVLNLAILGALYRKLQARQP
jgi:hypothetical protein